MASNPDLESLVSLLKVAEELLFSFPMPQEVVSKYEFIRGKTFSKCHLPNNNSHIMRLQLDAHSKLDKDSSRVLHTSTLEIKDPDIQNKLQQSSNFIQKLLTSLDRHSNFFNLSDIPLPTRSFDLSDSNLDPLYDSYKKLLVSAEYNLIQSFTKLGQKLQSASVYIQKLEQETRENSSFLSRNNSELLEKTGFCKKSLTENDWNQKKKIKELREEVLLSKNNSLNDVRKAQVREVEKIMKERDMFQVEAERLRDQLESVSSTLQLEIRTLHEEFERSTQELRQISAQKLKDSENKHLQKIEQLERSLYYKEKELLTEIQVKSGEQEDLVKRLEKDLGFFKSNSENLQNCLDLVGEVAGRIFKRFSEEPVEANDFMQAVVRQVEYLDRVIDKLSTDNNWLVDRMSVVNKENENLKKNLKEVRVQETLNEIETSASVLKNFEQSRNNLKKKFSESTIPFPDTYSKLVHKYSNFS